MKRFLSLIVIVSLLSGCAAIRSQQGEEPTALMEMALQYYFTGNPKEALGVLEKVYGDEGAAESEQQDALALAVLIHLERGRGENLSAAGKLLPKLKEGDNTDHTMLKRALTIAYNNTRQNSRASSEASACERELSKALTENRLLEQTVTKLRELSLE
ncbi:hypothetical protein FHR99_002383 [Litorivivens lipolytica]|uniref:Tetratricopeptide repeat-containing protein n=1 Tax=Litorivivens lipolytica TaxID=1524264 RepID=A0A7W4W764_9GAMM|nr:hypothetical protein [Litorivivens lipolytica]MBB3048117.1 hypothetical protein [Litorivivens lipolytica]